MLLKTRFMQGSNSEDGRLLLVTKISKKKSPVEKSAQGSEHSVVALLNYSHHFGDMNWVAHGSDGAAEHEDH
jgi:hypothetical protein